jgi:imidazolonepropionase-like amidohydrolase
MKRKMNVSERNRIANIKRLGLVFTMLFAVSAMIFFSAVGSVHADGAAGKLAIKAKRIVTAAGAAIENGTVLIEGERIQKVGSGIDVPAGFKVLDYGDAVVYPGLINTMTDMGISGVSMVKPMNDSVELGVYTPHVSAYTAFYPWRNLIQNTRDFGTLIVLTVPQGGLVSGKAALVTLEGFAPEDMLLRKEAAMMMKIPGVPWWVQTEKQKKTMMKRVEKYRTELKTFISKSHKYYLRNKNRTPVDAGFDRKYEAMKAIWSEKLPVIITAESPTSIKYAIELGKEFKLNLVLFGCYDAESVLKEIKASGYPVILDSMYMQNRKWEDGADKVFRLPGLLAREGILFALSFSRSATAFDLPISTGRAVAYGLSQEDAVKAMTVNPAKIFGIDGYGTIEAGKIANVVVADGNILETSTLIKDVFIKGKKATGKSFFRREYERARDKVSGDI